MLSRSSTRSLSSVFAIFLERVKASLAIIDACLRDISRLTTLRRVSERILFISSKSIVSILVMFNNFKPSPDFMCPTSLNDVFVKSEDDVRCELSCPCIQVVDDAVFLKPLVPIGERADINFASGSASSSTFQTRRR
jgi:hypothetical protein